MIRANNLARVSQKRTIRPLYAWHSAVPYACFLDTSAVGSTIIYPGQVAVKTTGEQMDFLDTAGDVPFGLFNNFINGTMDELAGGTEIGVWVGGRDAVFEVLAGFNATTETPLAAETWTSHNATRGGVPLFGSTGTYDAKLTVSVDTPGTFEVGRLIEAVSNSKIIVQLVLNTLGGTGAVE